MKVDCENCMNYVYDEEYEEYMCIMCFDEDDEYRFGVSKQKCPYFRFGDEYTIVRKQN